MRLTPVIKLGLDIQTAVAYHGTPAVGINAMGDVALSNDGRIRPLTEYDRTVTLGRDAMGSRTPIAIAVYHFITAGQSELAIIDCGHSRLLITVKINIKIIEGIICPFNLDLAAGRRIYV